LQPAEFVAALARSSDPRVRDTLISLLLLHPDLANVTTNAIETARLSGDEQTAEQLITLALAALYLQRMWRETLFLADVSARAPEEPFGAYWRERGLPAPQVDFGEAGLRALAEWERGRTGLAANYASDWDNQVDHLVLQEWHRSSENENTAAPVRILWPRMDAPGMDSPVDAGEDPMSMRPNVTRADIEQFLNDLGAMAHTTGRIYLAGGAALVHGQIRGLGASTEDIDLKLDVADEQAVEDAIRQLKVRSSVNVELASPADFIPLPPNWESMSTYVGRYGGLDVFYFDWVTLALAKIERGSSRDLHDVALLQQNGLIQRDDLEAAFQAIQPQLGHGRFFNVDPALFAQKVSAAVNTLWGSQP
jgi:uncharacterized nucleotidyltransferase DUF6036